MTSTDRLMPPRANLGKQFNSVMTMPMGQYLEWIAEPTKQNPHGLRTVMGFCLPTWQRGLVWTEAQKVAFIESAWRGLNLGTFTYNVAPIGHPLDNLLIDGQQRMSAIQDYLDGKFAVFGYRWSETTKVDKRMWSMTTIFGSYQTETTDESYLREYYNLTNFGGTSHAPAPVVDAARAVLASWDERMHGEREHIKTDTFTGQSVEYWSPTASMVDSPTIAGLRAALEGLPK